MLMRSTLRARARWAFPWSVAPAQGINLLTHSQDFENPAWFKTISTVSEVNTVTAPDGTLSADRIDFQAAPSSRISQSRACALTPHVLSVYAKSTTGTPQPFLLTAQNAGDSATYSSAVIATDTWQRFELPLGLTSAGTVTVNIENQSLYIAGALHIWGAQLETGMAATAYVRTEG